VLNMGSGSAGGPAVVIDNCWFEAGYGKADIWAYNCGTISPVIISNTLSNSTTAGCTNSIYADTCLLHISNFIGISHTAAIETVGCYGFILYTRVHDATINSDVMVWPLVETSGTPKYVNYNMQANFIKVQNTIDIGTDGVDRGVLTLWDGAGENTPGYIKIGSPDGTIWYLFVEDDGTIKVHNAAPTQIADGSAVGDQIKPYKEIIEQSLYPDPMSNDPISLFNGRRAISRYKKAVGDANGILELMVYYVECGNQLTVDYGDIDEKFYDSLESMFIDVLKILSKSEQQTIDNYLPRLISLVELATGIGWGYYDNMSDHLFEAFGDEDE